MPVGKGSLNRRQKVRYSSLELVPCVILRLVRLQAHVTFLK